MVSSVTGEDITKLRGGGYLAADITHRLPDAGQIMEVQPIIKHEPADKRVEGKSQSADEVGKKYRPLMGFWSRDDLPRVWEPVRNVCGQVSGFPELRNLLLRNGGDHPLASRSGHVWNGFAEKMRTCPLELECARLDGQGRRRCG